MILEIFEEIEEKYCFRGWIIEEGDFYYLSLIFIQLIFITYLQFIFFKNHYIYIYNYSLYFLKKFL